MNRVFKHLVIQNQTENTRYLVLSEKLLQYKGKSLIVLENCKTSELRHVEICPFFGTTRVLIKENVLCDINDSTNFIFARVVGDNVILIEDKNF